MFLSVDKSGGAGFVGGWRVDHGGDLLEGVGQSRGELLAAAELLDQVEAERPVVAGLVNVGDGSHQRTEDNLGVVLEEVDLEQKNNVDVPLFENKCFFSLICRGS